MSNKEFCEKFWVVLSKCDKKVWFFLSLLVALLLFEQLKIYPQRFFLKKIGIAGVKFTNLQQLDYHEKNDNFTTKFKDIWEDGSGTDSSIDYQKAYYFYQIEADGETAKINAIPKQEHLLSIASAVTKYDTAEGSDKIVEIICLAERPGTKDLVQALPPSMLNPVGSCINGKPITR